MKMKVVWVSLIFMVFYHATGADGDIHSMLRQLDEEENDPDTPQSEKDKLDEYRTTLIKQEILKMLGLESPPNISHIPHIPKQTLDSVLHQTDGKRVNTDSGGGASKQVIVMAEPDSSLELKNSETLFLRFHTNLKASFSSATLVLRRNPQVLTNKLLRKHRLLIVRIFGLPHRLSHLVGHPKIIEINRNWVKLDITSILKSKGSDNMMTNVSIEVICEECGSEKGFVNSKKRRPFLIFDVKPVTKMRKRRSTKCSRSCCLVRYKVNFPSMGYSFIMQPKNFYLNYCKGPCKSRGGTSLFLRRINILNPKKKTNPNDNCCVVRNLTPLSILYKDNQNNIIKKDVPDVTAVDCECA